MNSPGKKTGAGCDSLLQGIFPTQGSNPDLPHCSQILYHLSHQGSPFRIRELIFTLQHSKSKCNIQFSIVHQSFFLIFRIRDLKNTLKSCGKLYIALDLGKLYSEGLSKGVVLVPGKLVKMCP